MRAIKLIPNPKTKFVFGNSLSEEPVVFHSDSLASAVLTNYFLLHPGAEIDINNFPKLSSLYYGISTEDRDVFFLPFFRNELTEELIQRFSEQEQDRKIGKKINFISFDALQELLRGSESIKYHKNLRVLLSEEEYDLLENFEALYDYEFVQKNKIDRKTSTVEEGNLYGIASISLNNNVFFYFIMEDKTDFDDAVFNLSNSGIGGRRSLGYGAIDSVVEVKGEFVESLNQMFGKGASQYLALSIAFLKDSDELNSALSYQLYFSKGFIGHPFWSNRRKTLVGLKEGSVFDKRIEGKNFENTAPEGVKLKIYRIGKPLLLPLSSL